MPGCFSAQHIYHILVFICAQGDPDVMCAITTAAEAGCKQKHVIYLFRWLVFQCAVVIFARNQVIVLRG